MWVGCISEQALEFKYLGCILDESGTDVAKCHRKLMKEESYRCY